MTDRSTSHIAEFFYQLGTLLRSGLPLPGCLGELGRSLPSGRLRKALAQVQQDVTQGKRLAASLARHGDLFPPFYRELIAAGEGAGTLPETLATAAESAMFSRRVSARIRDLLAYPLLLCHTALILLLVVSFVIPAAMETLTAGQVFTPTGMPLLTRIVGGIAFFLHRWRGAALVVYAALLAGTVWLYMPSATARSVSANVLTRLPLGVGRAMRCVELARVCKLLALLLRRGMPAHDALATTARCVDEGRLANALRRVSAAVARGATLSRAFAEEQDADSLLTLAIAHAPEERLIDELESLAPLYEQRSTVMLKVALEAWGVLAILLAALLVGTVVLAIYMPIIQVLRMMGGTV